MLHPSHYYHLYNHANGNENIFKEERNYYFFLEKVNKYLQPFMDIYSYCLMPNHFHFLIRIKDENILIPLLLDKNTNVINEMKQIEFIYSKISKSLSNLFSSYTQSFNKLYHRKGSLFMPNFKTNPVEDDLSYCALTHYIHANPVHHGFVTDIKDWKFSSFNTLCSQKPTKLDRDHLINIFGNEQIFLSYHNQPINRKYKWHD